MAIDPITLTLLGLQAGSAIYKGVTGARQLKEAQRGLSELGEAPITKPAEYANLIREAKAGELVQRQIDEINKSVGTGSSALQRGGSRAVLGGTQALVDAGTRAKTTAIAQQQKNVLSALERDTIGAERAATRAVEQFQNQQKMLQTAALAGAENISGAVSDVGTGVGGAVEAYAENPDLFSTEKKPMRKGGKIYKTKGKFSHEENPIDVVQDGVKVAELTGGEYVFNPKQSKKMLQLSKSGDSKLHKFVRNLLSQERFK